MRRKVVRRRRRRASGARSASLAHPFPRDAPVRRHWRTRSRATHPFGVTGAPVPARRTRKHWCAGREVVRRRRRHASGTPYPKAAPPSAMRTRSASPALPLPRDAPASTGARGEKWCTAVVVIMPQAPVRRHWRTRSRATHP
ncbi:hypothetical protein ABIE37_001217 [Arthrobacter bambusae]|uniref:Uncharacterized protein n=1 Tax=Arthrobacter bambusae TaxID=1338426 RepID=A0ABV2P3V5_9MICC